MKLTHYIYICTALAMLTACSDDIDPVYTVGEADNAVLFSAGVNQEAGAATRAAGDVHVALQDGTYVHLRAAGPWTGHTPESVVEYRTYQVPSGATADADKYKVLTGADVPFYWDDYGTADPSNTTNRSNGLTFWAYAIDGKGATSNITGLQAPASTATADEVTAADNTWKAMSWTLPTNQSTSDWHDYDLLFAKTTGHTFDAQKVGTYAKIDLKHAMSKITVNLRANKGFPISDGVHIFDNTPEVKLLGFTIKGTADASNEKMTASTENGDVKDITTKKAATATTGYTATYEALVMPDRVLNASVTTPQTETEEAETSSTENIVWLKADGNEYKVTAAQIVKAIVKAGDGTGNLTTESNPLTGTLKSGKNYVINIIVNKTEVHVSARIVNWVDVTAEPAEPKIPFAMNYGDKNLGDVFNKSYSLYYNEKKDYLVDGTKNYTYGSKIEGTNFYQNESAYNGSAFSPENYWPDHKTKYFFRGIYPQTGNGSESSKPSVTTFDDAAATPQTHQGIPVSNAVYNSADGSFPSSLMLGIPFLQTETAIDKTEPGDGIGATEGTITLTFGYCMSQVIVRLMSSGADEPDNIDFGSNGTGGAEQAVVNIINGYTEGYIRLSDGLFDPGTKTKGLYCMNAVSTTPPAIPTKDQYSSLASSWSTTSFSGADYLTRHDVVVPQSLEGMKFQITTGPSGNKDLYEIDIKSIPVYVAGSTDQTTIDKWEPGKRYYYTLKITKTKIKIEARIKDWIDVYAGGDFWL